MGVLIIVGIGVVAYTIISRLAAGVSVTAEKTPVTENVAPAVTASPQPLADRSRQWKPRPLKAFGEVAADIPAGAIVESMTSDRRRLILNLRLAGGTGQEIHVFSLDTGERLGLIRLKP